MSFIGQTGDTFSSILQMIYLFSFLLFMMYGQKFQVWMMLREISNVVGKLKVFKEEARRLAIDTVSEFGKSGDPSPRIDQLMEYFTIWPINLDPAGIIPKIDHIIDVRDQRFKNEVKRIAPEADKVQSSNIEGVLEVALGLNLMYKIINHYYLLGKKTMSIYIIMQVQIQLPLIVQTAKAFCAAVKAFAEGQPIGDGAGALAAARMMYGNEAKEIAKNIVAAQIELDGRQVVVLKADGPGANIGKYGDGIKRIIEENKGNVAMIIMVDAARKWEGEESGSTSEGTGSVIGGMGVDAFTIEEVALKYNVPVNGIKIKQSIQESISPMTKAISDGVDVAIAKVKRMISEETKEGDLVIIAGVGNTVGIGQ